MFQLSQFNKIRYFVLMKAICILVYLSTFNMCIAQVSITGDIPYAKNLKHPDGSLKIWTLDRIRQDKDDTVNFGGKTIKEKDIRARASFLGYQSLSENESKSFTGELDLTEAMMPAKLAILVDDIATLTVIEVSRGDEVKGGIFKNTYTLRGGALWNPRAYKEFSTSLPAGRKYKLTLKYENKSHLTTSYDGDIDIDGISIYVSILPILIDVEIREKGKKSTDESILVKTGATLQFALSDKYFNEAKKFEPFFTWKFRQMKRDGTYEKWAEFGMHGKGTKFEHITALGGIFQVKVVLISGQESYYERDKTEVLKNVLREGYAFPEDIEIGNGVAGQPDCVGVCDEQEQIDLCREAQKLLGSFKYDIGKEQVAEYGFPKFAKGRLRCGIFVAHIGVAANLKIPKTNGILLKYPPLANEWAGHQRSGVLILPITWAEQRYIPNWDLFINPEPADEDEPEWLNPKPQPGWIIAHPKPGDAGHVGIIDYDGGGIGAGVSGTVNKKFDEFFDGTSKYRRYSK